MDETFASSFCARLDLKKKNAQEGCKEGIKRTNFHFF